MDEDVFINLSKWSAHRVGIAQLTQCCVFSRRCLREAHLGVPRLPLGGVWEGKRTSSPAGILPVTSPGALPRSPATRRNGRTQSIVSSDFPGLAPPSLPTRRCVQLPFELGTSRLEFSSATSCVQNLVYKISKGSR